MPNRVQDFARRLRENPTPAESWLWAHLQDIGGWNFQVPVNFRQTGTAAILDFFHPASGLAVELDGEYHDQPEQKAKDEYRTRQLGREHGIRVVRFSNEDVFFAIDEVLKTIASLSTPVGGGWNADPAKNDLLPEVDRFVFQAQPKPKKKLRVKEFYKLNPPKGAQYRVVDKDRMRAPRPTKAQPHTVIVPDTPEARKKHKRRQATSKWIPVRPIVRKSTPDPPRFTTDDFCIHDIPSFSCSMCKLFS